MRWPSLLLLLALTACKGALPAPAPETAASAAVSTTESADCREALNGFEAGHAEVIQCAKDAAAGKYSGPEEVKPCLEAAYGIVKKAITGWETSCPKTHGCRLALFDRQQIQWEWANCGMRLPDEIDACFEKKEAEMERIIHKARQECLDTGASSGSE